MLNIVLHQPEIPANTGNIARLCAATDTRLHLIKPLGFSLSDKYVKRAGLDYWDLVDICVYDNYEHFANEHQGATIFYATTKAKKIYTEVKYDDNCFIMFGKESAGIPEEIIQHNPDTSIRIPMREQARSLNLANSVSIVVYEAIRQNHFMGLQTEGNLHRLSWHDSPTTITPINSVN